MFIEDLEEKDDLNNESVNQNGVCRTTPDTPGLLTIFKKERKKIKGLCEGFIINFKYDQ